MKLILDPIKTFPKFTFLFVCIMILEVLGLTVIPEFHMVSKAMIMATLIGFYVVEAKPQNHIFLTGFIFALLGDVFLLFKNDDFFVIGLSCFLIMQICYASVFNRKRRVPRNKDYFVPGALILFGIIMIAYLWKDIEGMRVGISLYSIAIITMAITGYLRHPRLRGYSTVLLGIVLFIISDALIAIDRFSSNLVYGSIAIMITYMLAQYFIITGELLSTIRVVKPEKKKKVRKKR